jgi:hypothetical protein
MNSDLDQTNSNANFKVCTSCGQRKGLPEFHHFGKDKKRVGKWCELCLQRQKRRRVTKHVLQDFP